MNVKNATTLFGIIVFTMVIGFTLAACESPTDPGSKSLTGITVTTPPTKVQYNLNENFDPAGMVVTATYSDGSTAAVTGYTTNGFSSDTAGNKTITVTYQGKTDTFTVTVIDPGKETVAKPTVNPVAGEVASSTTVTLSTTTNGAEIWYTTNGGVPAKNGSGSTKYTTPIAVTAAVTIKAIAFKDDMNDSAILEAAYTIVAADTVAKPTAIPAAGAVTSGTTVALSTSTSGAEIWYTTNGSAPAKNGAGSTKYETPIPITAAITIKAIAVKDDMNDSAVLEAAYTITVSKSLTSIEVTTLPTKVQYNLNENFDPAGMIITATYSDSSTEAVTGYTTNGFSSDTAGNKTITVTYQGKTDTFTVTVIDPSKETAATPTASPAAGEVASGTTVTLSTTTNGAEIWYTTNGDVPAKNGSGSTKYTTPIAVTAAVTIKAIAVKDSMNDSAVLEAAYTILAINTVAKPTTNPAAGAVTSGTTVTLATATEGAVIHYTTNGDTPTASSPIYSSPIVITTDVTIKAIAVKNGMNDSQILEAAYTIQIVNPGNQTPVTDDFVIGNLTQTAGNVTAVTITPKQGKSNGNITIYYNGSTTLPTTVGTYPVTFDVAAATGFNAATGLSAGTLTINAATPVADDFDIGNLNQTVVNITSVTITPKAGKSGGAITIYYNGSTTLPSTAGAYPVTFDVTAVTGWNAVTGLSAGTLTIIEAHSIGVQFSGFGDETVDLTVNNENDIRFGEYLIVTVNGDFDTDVYPYYQWYQNGNYLTYTYSNSYSLYIGGWLPIGIHTITAVVTKNGIPYSKEVTFRVVR